MIKTIILFNYHKKYYVLTWTSLTWIPTNSNKIQIFIWEECRPPCTPSLQNIKVNVSCALFIERLVNHTTTLSAGRIWGLDIVLRVGINLLPLRSVTWACNFLLKAFKFKFRISLQWLIHIINSVDKSKVSCDTLHQCCTTVSLKTCSLY